MESCLQLILFLFVIGGLFLGWFTPTESGAFGAFGAIIISLFYSKLTFENLKIYLANTIRNTSMVILLLVVATIFGRFLAMTRLPFEVAEWASTLPVGPVFILITALLVFVIGGSIMDAMGFLIIAIPIFYPTITALGYDPIWFAILLCIVTSLGGISPPVGINVLITNALLPEVSVATIFESVNVFIVTYAVCIAILIAFPQLVLFVL